jgi:hypothetical protein
VELYKQKLRVLLRTPEAYHYTPLNNFSSASAWVVLEYVGPDKKRDVATLFRTSNFDDAVYRFGRADLTLPPRSA